MVKEIKNFLPVDKNPEVKPRGFIFDFIGF